MLWSVCLRMETGRPVERTAHRKTFILRSFSLMLKVKTRQLHLLNIEEEKREIETGMSYDGKPLLDSGGTET